MLIEVLPWAVNAAEQLVGATVVICHSVWQLIVSIHKPDREDVQPLTLGAKFQSDVYEIGALLTLNCAEPAPGACVARYIVARRSYNDCAGQPGVNAEKAFGSQPGSFLSARLFEAMRETTHKF